MLKRVATAIVLISLIIVILTRASLWVFNAMVLLIILLGLREFYRLVIPNDTFSNVVGCLFGLTSAAILTFFGVRAWFMPFFIALFFTLITAHMIYSTVAEGVVSRIGLTLFGTAYLSFTLPAFAWMRGADHGRFLVVLTIGVVALGDTFAYAAGKLFGRHKLAPLISPKKTVEGFIASFFGGVAASVICWQIFWRELPVSLMIFLGIAVAAVGAFGDLIESLIKRGCHVKDSGTLLPGHGGILDRIDALVFAAPAVYFTFKFLGYI